jgi:type I restriction enzyme M protein
MSANKAPQEFFDAVREIADASALLPSALALTVARMIAAAELMPFGRGNAPGFLDQTRELTKVDWLAIIATLAKCWKSTGAMSVNPFENPVEDPPLSPGGLERLRKLILGYLFRAGPDKPTAPSWLLHSVLELTDPRDLFGRTPKGADARLRDLVVETVGVTANSRFFCAYEGAVGVALELALAGADVTLDVQQADLATLCACLALSSGLNLRVRSGDPIQLARDDISTPLLGDPTFETSIVFPPFGMRHSSKSDDGLRTGLISAVNSEAAGVTLALARGRNAALCVVPPSFMFQTTKNDQVFKEQIIQNFELDTIVGLPRGVFGSSPIAAALLVFKPHGRRRRSSELFMIDARGYWDHSINEAIRSRELAAMIRDHMLTDISLSVPIDELAANDFNLSVERYVLDPEARRLRELTAEQSTVPLSEVAELYRPQAIPASKNAGDAQHLTVSEVGVADIDEAGVVRSPGKQLAITPDAAPQARRARLEAGDVLLVIKGSVGKVGFIRDIPRDETWLASQSFVILRLRQHAPLNDPRILFRFLSSSLGNASIQSVRVGVAVPGLQMADVRRLMIVLPDLKTQAAIVRDIEGLFEQQDRIQHLRDELIRMQSEIWPERLGSHDRRTTESEPKSRKPRPSRRTAS